VKWLENNGFLRGAILDYGCGYGEDWRWLARQGFSDVAGWDPNHALWANQNRLATPETISPGNWDIVLCTYVLNVLENADEVADVMSRVQACLQPHGRAFFTVRRDGKGRGRTKAGTFQDYTVDPAKHGARSIRRTANYEIFELTA
jgi:2-polyprenyl-3-methyl-5-hydroxy-6-metoxy-1,4-benzoquinol methylase